MLTSYHIRYSDLPCPRCGAGSLYPCRTRDGWNYQFKYTHAARRHAWWRRRNQ